MGQQVFEDDLPAIDLQRSIAAHTIYKPARLVIERRTSADNIAASMVVWRENAKELEFGQLIERNATNRVFMHNCFEKFCRLATCKQSDVEKRVMRFIDEFGPLGILPDIQVSGDDVVYSEHAGVYVWLARIIDHCATGRPEADKLKLANSLFEHANLSPGIMLDSKGVTRAVLKESANAHVEWYRRYWIGKHHRALGSPSLDARTISAFTDPSTLPMEGVEHILNFAAPSPLYNVLVLNLLAVMGNAKVREPGDKALVPCYWCRIAHPDEKPKMVLPPKSGNPCCGSDDCKRKRNNAYVKEYRRTH